MPESTHMLMWAMSDRAIPRSALYSTVNRALRDAQLYRVGSLDDHCRVAKSFSTDQFLRRRFRLWTEACDRTVQIIEHQPFSGAISEPLGRIPYTLKGARKAIPPFLGYFPFVPRELGYDGARQDQ